MKIPEPSMENTCVARLRESLEATYDLIGDVAEIGVYTGGSAFQIQKSKNPSKHLYLCDTFEGLKDWNEIDQGIHNLKNGDYTSKFDDVKNIFLNQSKVSLIKGYFPESATKSMINAKYSFVHLDVDTYQSTINSLYFFYPRMVDSSHFVIHDYGILSGVTKAVEEFINKYLSELKFESLTFHQARIILRKS